MKKSLIALAVAATAATPMVASAAVLQAAGDQEGINVYGSLRPQFVSSGDEKIGDGGSRWGIQGSHDLGNGLKSTYRFEQKLSTESASFPTSGRLAYAGLGGNFGWVGLGQQWTPYYVTIASPSDIFASTGVGNYNNTGGPFRAGNVLAYALPQGMVVGGAIAFVINGDVADADGNILDTQDSVDATSAGLTFNAGPMKIGLGVHDTSATSKTRVGFSVGGDFGPVAATLMFEDTDPKEGDGGQNPWAITVSSMGFAAQYSDTDEAIDSTAFTLGYTYKMSANTRMQFAWETADWADNDKFVARYRVDF